MEMPRSLILRMMLKFSLTKSGDKPSEGSSISSSFGARIRPRPIETIACSPPDMVPASCIRRSARRGNKRKISAMRSWVTASEGSGAEPQILLDRELGKHFAAFRDTGHARGDDLVRRQRGDVLAIKCDTACARWRQAQDRADQCGLAGAVRAEQACNAPWLYLE